jgi:murein DD-endopeptidase MepM/ murein hydrolase activator NlpD
MNRKLRYILTPLLLVTALSAFAPSKDKFTPAEMQQISIETPGLFAASDAFTVDFTSLHKSDFSFPLPVGKATPSAGNSELEISTKEGDAVKAMFDGVVRLSRNIPAFGNVIVLRHANGLETVYGENAQNMVKVRQEVKAGQTVAIVGGRNGRSYCRFAIMVNGRRINPETILDIRRHSLKKQLLLIEKRGARIEVNTRSGEKAKTGRSLDPDRESDPFLQSVTFKLNLEEIEQEHWAYPLPGSHVISPYGGKRHHGGVDIKTKPNDKILAAFDGVVTRACAYFGYGNCIVIRHAYGFETLYSHQSRNFVKVGQRVKAGQVIGLTGRTGRATTEHLHFETHFRGRRFNPAVLFDHIGKKLQAVTLTLSKSGMVSSKRN